MHRSDLKWTVLCTLNQRLHCMVKKTQSNKKVFLSNEMWTFKFLTATMSPTEQLLHIIASEFSVIARHRHFKRHILCL